MEKKAVETEARTAGFTRGRFLSLGLTLGAGTALVACSGQTGSGSGSGSSGGGETTQASSSSASGGSVGSIVAASEVPVGEAYEFRDGGQPAVLIHESQNKFVAYSAVCTHQGCTVAYKNSELVCPCHGSVFSVANGEPSTGPANSPLPTIDVRVEGQNVVKA